MRIQEQNRIQELLVKYSQVDDIYELIDLTSLMYRTAVDENISYYDYLRVLLADTVNNVKGGGVK